MPSRWKVLHATCSLKAAGPGTNSPVHSLTESNPNIDGSPLPGAVLCMGGAPMTKVVLKVPLLCSTPCSFFASQPHAIYLQFVILRIYNVLYELFDLCYVKSLFCVVRRLCIVLCKRFGMCSVSHSPNGFATLRRARFARFGSVRGYPGT